MTSTTFFFVFIPLLAFILLAINLIFAPHNPYSEKDSAFECGFHSFLGQNRTQFSISFFIFALLFLLFDLEILLVYPYIVSAYSNDMYGLLIMLIFFGVLTLGFAFELGKNALKIDSRQMYSVALKQSEVKSHYSSFAYILPLMKMDTLTNAFSSVNHILCVRSVIRGIILIILNIGLIPLTMFICLICYDKSLLALITETSSLEILDYSFFNLFNNGFNLFICIYNNSDFIIQSFFNCLYSNP